jgi:hypothetical protein
MNELEEKNPFLMYAIEAYPEVKTKISQGRKCAICGKSFLITWLECVQFVRPSKVTGAFCVNVSKRPTPVFLSLSNLTYTN